MFKTILIIGLVISAIGHIVNIVSALSKAAQQGVQADATPTSAADSESNNGVRR